MTTEDALIAQLAALSIVLSTVDAVFPSPLPGVKPGLANIIVLVTLKRFGWRTAVAVSLLRVWTVSLILGYWCSPGFFLSLSGALMSVLVLFGAQFLLRSRWFSLLSVSILAALGHFVGQLLVVSAFLMPWHTLSYWLPFFAAAALIFGALNGIIAVSLDHHITQLARAEEVVMFLYRLVSRIKPFM